MNYDLNGPWSTTGVGPNAPLVDSCSDVKAGSATSAIAAWTGANFPADQILLGLAAYGHSFNVDPSKALDTSGKIASYPAFNPNTTVVSGTGKFCLLHFVIAISQYTQTHAVTLWQRTMSSTMQISLGVAS